MRLSRSLAMANLWLMALWIVACSTASPAQATYSSTVSGKIAPALLNAAQQLQRGGGLPANGPVRSDSQGRLQVYVHVSNTSPETLAALAGHGLQDIEISPNMHVVQGWVNPANLLDLAALASVMRITPPRYAHPH